MKDDFILFDFLVPVFGIGFLFHKTGWNVLTVFITIFMMSMFILINVLLNIDSDVKDKYIYRNLNFYIKKSKTNTFTKNEITYYGYIQRNSKYDKSKLRSKR